MTAVLDFIKKIAGIIFAVLLTAGAVVLSILGVKKIASIGKVQDGKLWKPIIGDDKSVMVYDGGQWKKIGLPKVDGEQITVGQIGAIGTSRIEGGKVNVEIKHVVIDRRGPVNRGF